MLSRRIHHLLDRSGFHSAWVIATTTFRALLAASAAALLQPLSREFGWSTEQISSVFALRFLIPGLSSPFTALFIDRFGLRRIMVAAAALVGSSCALATCATHLWQFFLLWGVVLGFGTGLTALVFGAMVASRWSTQRRGFVMGLFAAGTATGQLIFLPSAAWLIQHHGWRYAVIPPILTCVLVATLGALLMCDHPQELGIASYAG